MRIPRMIVSAVLFSLAVAGAAGPVPRPNVLFIAIDDQNDWIGAFGGHPLAVLNREGLTLPISVYRRQAFEW